MFINKTNDGLNTVCGKNIARLRGYMKISQRKLADKMQLVGIDIDKNAISLAMRHAKRAGIDQYLHIQTQDVKDLRSRYAGGTIVTNPPYGERVYDIKQAEQCYKELGEALKNMQGWSLFAITSAKSFERYLGKRADRERKLYNSNRECK